MNVALLEDTIDRVEFFKKVYHGHFLHHRQDVASMIDLLKMKPYDIIYLDHDLGGQSIVASGKDTGYEVASAMVRTKAIFNKQRYAHVYIHSQNPVGVENMYKLLHPHYFTMIVPITSLYHAFERCGVRRCIKST